MHRGGTLKRVFELGGVMNKGIEAITHKLEDSRMGATLYRYLFVKAQILTFSTAPRRKRSRNFHLCD